MVCMFLLGCRFLCIFWLNFEVGGDLSLGESFDTLLKEDNRYLFDAVGKAVKLVSIVYVDLK